MGQEPIAHGELAAELRAAIADITEALAREAEEKEDPFGGGNLSGGSAGIGLLFAHLAEFGGFPNAVDIAERCFDHAAVELSKHEMSLALYHGVTGIPWSIDLAYNLSADDSEEDDESGEDEEGEDEIDALILETVSRTPWRRDYDVIGGLAGIGLYAIDCPRPLSGVIASEVISRLIELAERDERGARWPTSGERLIEWQRERAPNGYYNLGVAHGIPGVVGFLARVCARGLDDRAGSLYGDSVRWLMTTLDEHGGTFPSWARIGGGSDPARFGWCYGDPGVACGLATAAAAVGDEQTLTRALEIGRNAAKRAARDTDVDDPAICHGAAGAAHLFNRLFQLSGEPVFRDASEMWLRDCLSLRRPGGIGGFASIDIMTREEGDREEMWKPYPGLLDGAAGIAFVFLSALDSRYARWDRFLLTDIVAA